MISGLEFHAYKPELVCRKIDVCGPRIVKILAFGQRNVDDFARRDPFARSATQKSETRLVEDLDSSSVVDIVFFF